MTKENPGRNIGIKLVYDPMYIYFVDKAGIYRVSKKHAIRSTNISDTGMKKRIRVYNAKLREKVGEIPIQVYRHTHVYCVKGDGNVADFGLFAQPFTRKY